MLGLALLTLAAFAAAVSGNGYIDGREYVYRYYGQIYSGFPRIKSQYSGYAFTSDVIVQPHGDYALVKVDKVKKAQFNEEFEHVSEHEYHYSDLPAHAEFLTRPFKVYRKHGVVSKFEVSKDEPVFSVNMKRGLITLFNLNFEQEGSEPSTDDNEVNRDHDAHVNHDEHFFKVYEDGVLGDCETSYVIEHHPYGRTPDNNIVLNVTKSRNYHKCRNEPNQVYSTFYGHECGKSDYEKAHTLHGNAFYHYDIRGDRHSYVIEHVTTEGEIAYTPYPEHGQSVATYINRTLELVAVKEVDHALEFPADSSVYNSLSYEFEHKKDFKEPRDLKKPHYLYHVLGRKVPSSDIRSQFEQLTHAYDDEHYAKHAKEQNFPAKFLELVRSVATIGFDEISDLWVQLVQEEKNPNIQHIYRKLFLDVLVNLGTNPALLFGKHLIEDKIATPQESAYIIQQTQFHVKEISLTLFDEIEELCENEAVKSRPPLHIACVMSLSNLVHDNCISHYHPEGLPDDQSNCPAETAVKYFNYIARNYEQTENEVLKIAYIKAAGNIGVKEIIPYVRPYVEGHGHVHTYRREAAIWSLVHIGHRYHDKIRELLVPVYKNHTENYVLRLAAFNVLMQAKPKLHELEALARSLKLEKDDQVRSFVYSTLVHKANSTHPCDRKSSRDAHYALRILEDVKEEFEHYDYSYSHNHYVGGYDHDYDFGGTSRFAYLANDQGYIPRSAYVSATDFIGGKNFNTFGVGFKQYGLEKIFDKLFGPHDDHVKRSFFDIFKKRSKRDVSSVDKELNEIKQKVNLPVREYEPIHGEIFFKYMGNHLSFLSFDDHSFEDFFKEGRFVIPDLPQLYQQIKQFYYQRFFLPLDQFYVIPSESGLPIIFDYKQPTYFYYHNLDAGVKVEPEFFAEDRQGAPPTDVKVSVAGHLICDKELIATMSVVVPFDQVTFGGGINRRSTLSLPLKFGVHLNLKEEDVKFKWLPVAPHEIYHFEYEPFTFVDSYANSVPLTLEQNYHPVRRANKHEVSKHYFHDALGVGFDVKGDYENEFNSVGHWLDFLLNKDYREKFYYLYSNPHFEPYHFDVTFSKAEQDPTNEVELELQYEYHTVPYFPEQFGKEGFESFQRQGDKAIYTCNLKGHLQAHGTKERKIDAEFAYSRDLTKHYHKYNVYYERTPFRHDEHENFKVCGSGYLKYPHYDIEKLVKLETLDMDHTVESEVKVHFGKDCSSDKKIKIQGRFEETEEQHEYELRREEKDTSEHYNPYSHYYHECLLERQHGVLYGENCMHYLELTTTLDKYTFHAKHEKLSPEFLNCTYKIGGFLKHLLYNHGEHNYLDVHNPDDEYHIEANVSLHIPFADIRVRRPRSESHYHHFYVPHYQGFRSYPHYEDVEVKKSYSDHRCKIEGDNVYTFDHFEYNLPPIDCYKVIARDCSPNEHFTVLATKISHPKYAKAVKVFLGQHKVEFLPVSDESDIIVRVDGKRVALTENEPYLYDQDESHDPKFYVTFRGAYYALHSKLYGLIVSYDGRAVIVEVSPVYRHKMCGICGNYNGQKYDGYTTEEGCVFDDENAYAYSYAIPSDTCSVPAVEARCPGEGGFGCNVLRTQVVELKSGKVPQTCFSLEPAIQCAEGCTEKGNFKRLLEFHCLPSKDDSTKALLRQQQVRVLHEVRRKSKDHEANVELPERCARQ